MSGVRTVTTSNSSTGVDAVGGVLGGAAAGAGAEKPMRGHDALELTILLDNGQEIVIVQGPDEIIHGGRPVRILTSSDGNSRVQHD